MSNHCQFCDKEMLLDASVVQVKGYITCGDSACRAHANSNANHHARLAHEQKHPPIIEDHILVFKTTNPYSPASWRVVKPEDHPGFMKDLETVGMMLEGNIVNIYKANQKGMVYYRAEKVKNIKKQLGGMVNA